jgi:hypothetical protein
MGPEISNESQIVVPTAILQVEEAGRGQAATVRVVQLFEDARTGQALIPLQRFPVPTEVAPMPRELGLQTRVVALPRGVVLPSLQHYVMLDARLRDGVAIGDQFTLLRPPVDLGGGDVTPEEPIALVQVVRVTDHGTTAIVVDQRHPAIHEGTRARLTAKMP